MRHILVLRGSALFGQHQESWFAENAQTIPFVFSANQIRLIWQDLHESRTSGVEPSQKSRLLVQTKGAGPLGTRMDVVHNLVQVHACPDIFYSNEFMKSRITILNLEFYCA